MKFSHIFCTLGILLCLTSCSKDEHGPYKPSEWLYDKYSDTGVLPGDDFYRFVCGKGIETEGSDAWTPLHRWMQQQNDYTELAFSDKAGNPVPVLSRLNELKNAELSDEQIADAFANMRKRLNEINGRVGNKGFPEKAAEYCRNGYALFLVRPLALDGHRFALSATAVYMGMLKDLPEQQLMQAGIEKEYKDLLPKARKFEKYLLDNIKDQGESIDGLDARVCDDCRKLKGYVESFVHTKAGGGAFERFAAALGNHNPNFVPSDDMTRQYFELVDKMQDEEMKEAADAFLWCASVSYDMSIILEAGAQMNLFMTLLYPNLLVNISHTFCDMYFQPECRDKSKEIFELFRSTMKERIARSDWMSPYTKARAREKIDAMECHAGILDWSRYEADMPVSDDFCSALHEVGRSNVSKMMAYSGESSNLNHIIASLYMVPMSGTSAYSANAFYLQNANAMIILPSTSILLDMNREFPFLTYIVGHEMCHGFDANGANFNECGELGDWWSIEDRLVFKMKQDQLISIFNQYYVGGTTFCNGARTITEDMADLGGLEIAYYTISKILEEKYSGDELMEMKRRFFKSYAILYAAYSSTESKMEQVEKDVHSPNEYRINGIVNHIDDWYRLFDVTPERKFHLAPERRVYLW